MQHENDDNTYGKRTVVVSNSMENNKEVLEFNGNSSFFFNSFTTFLWIDYKNKCEVVDARIT